MHASGSFVGGEQVGTPKGLWGAALHGRLIIFKSNTVISKASESHTACCTQSLENSGSRTEHDYSFIDQKTIISSMQQHPAANARRFTAEILGYVKVQTASRE